MQTVELSIEKRDISTKGALRQVRLNGGVPAVVYGGGKEPATASVNAKEFVKLLKGHGLNALVNLKSASGSDVVLIKEIQRDVLGHQAIHVDFRRISMTEKLEISVPLRVAGEAPGVKLHGGILEMVIHALPVRCLPTDIPAHIDLDVSALNLNDALRVKDIVLPKGVESAVADGERLVLHIVAPTEFKEETPAAGAPAAGAGEPEVIAKGKKPEEGAEGAAPAAGAKGAAPAAGAKPGAAAPAAKAAPAAGAKK
jgi:large subunit ribosomal protein L25